MAKKYSDIGDYKRLEVIGKGAFATVFLARNKKYNYLCAIKVLNDAIDGGEESEIYKAFVRECRTSLGLRSGCHPNIVAIFEPQLVGDRAFVEMDYIKGVNLTQFTKSQGGKAPFEEVLHMALDISSALSYCHHDVYLHRYDKNTDDIPDDIETGLPHITSEKEQALIEKYRIIHNDIHPGNIMRREDGRYVILDFGLAIEGKETLESTNRIRAGALEYKSPEKYEQEDLPHGERRELLPPSDIYSFGCVMYYMAAGVPPFPLRVPSRASNVPSDEIVRIKNAHKQTTPPQISRTDIPEWFKSIVMQCIQKKPSERFPSGFELHKAIVEGAKQHEFTSNASHEEAQFQQPQIKKLEEQLKQTKQQYSDLNESHKESLKENENLRQSLNELNQEKESLNSEISKLKENSDYLQSEVRDKTKIIDLLRKEIKSLQKKAKRIQKKSVFRVLLNLFLIIVALGVGIAGTYYMIATNPDAQKVLFPEYDDYTDQIETLTAENERLRKETSQFDKSTNNLNQNDTAVNALNAMVNTLEEALRQSREQNETLNKENSSLNQQLDAQKRKNATQAQTINTQARRIEILMEQI